MSVHRERDDLPDARFEASRSAGSTRLRRSRSPNVTLPFVRELERVRQEVLQHLLQAASRSANIDFGRLRIEANEEVDVLRLGDVTERALDIAAQLVEHEVGGLDGDGAGFDLRRGRGCR